MTSNWHTVYYETEEGQCPIQEFIDARKERDQAKILGWFALLETRGPHLPRPYADLLEDGIHELRITVSGDQVRCLYFFCYREFIILTHAFVKHTRAVPKSEIRRAQRSRADCLSRFDEQQLRESLDEDVSHPS
jgi:phage-related protein